MNYNNVDQSKLKGLHKVIESYGVNVIKAHNYLLRINPNVNNIKGQFYLLNNDLLKKLVTL